MFISAKPQCQEDSVEGEAEHSHRGRGLGRLSVNAR